MSHVRTPTVTINGTAADPDTIAYPLTITAGRGRPDQQPEPAAASFTMPLSAVAAVPKRGHTIEISIPTTPALPIFTGRVTDVRATHEPWQADAIAGYQIAALGWSSTYANLPAGTTITVLPDTEDEQLADLLLVWTFAGYTLDEPDINSSGLDTTNVRLPLYLTNTSLLLPTLQDFAARSGSAVWETPTEILITGPAYRDGATPAGTIPNSLVLEDIGYQPTELINDLTVLYGAIDEYADTATYTPPLGIFNWDIGTGTPSSGQAIYSPTEAVIRFHLTDSNGDPQREWLQALNRGDVIVVRDLVNNTYAGFMMSAYPTWSGGLTRVTVPVIELDGNWDDNPPAGVSVAVWSKQDPPRSSTRLTDAASIAEYGIRAATTDSGAALEEAAIDRGNAILDRWAADQWVIDVQVRTDLTTSQTQWDDTVELLQPNTLVTLPALYTAGQIGPYDGQVWIEGVVHEWDRTEGGRLIHSATLTCTAHNADSVPPDDDGTYPSSTTYPATSLYPGAA